MSYWRINWDLQEFIFFSTDEAVRFINGHPGCNAQYVQSSEAQ